METTETSWHRTEERIMNFTVDAAYPVKSYAIAVYYSCRLNETVNWNHTLIGKIYSNGVYVSDFRHCIFVSSGGEGGYYGPIEIPLDTLRVGENTVKIVITFDVSASEKPLRPGVLHFVVGEMAVKASHFKLAVVLMTSFAVAGVAVDYKRAPAELSRHSGPRNY